MNTILTTVLVAGPVTFLAGWLCAKVLLLKALPQKVRRVGSAEDEAVTPTAEPAAEPPTRQNSLTDEHIRQALTKLQDVLNQRSSDADALKSEIESLRSAIAEGEQANHELREELARKVDPPEQQGPDLEEVQKLLKVQQGRVVKREERIAELETQLQGVEKRVTNEQARVGRREANISNLEAKLDEVQKALTAEQARVGRREAKISELSARLHSAQTRLDDDQGNEAELAAAVGKLESDLREAVERADAIKSKHQAWRERMKPLAQQFRQQRLIISELREELRKRDGAQPEKQKPAVQPTFFKDATVNSNLQALRGVGPALQQKLNEQGVYNLSQFADMDAQSLHQLSGKLGINFERVQKYDWIRQAREILGQQAPKTDASDAVSASPASTIPA